MGLGFAPFDETRKIQKLSPAPYWHKPVVAGRTPDVTTASYRYSQDFFHPALAPPKFQIKRDENFFMIGSCFARGLERALANRKFNVLSFTDKLDHFAIGAVGSALGATNKYNLASIMNELSWAVEGGSFPERAIVELDNENYFDPHMTPVFPPAPYEEVAEKHRIMTEAVARVVDSDIVVVTLGLVEVWKDAELDLITNAINPILYRKYPERFLFGRLGYAENMRLLQEVYSLLTRRARPGFRMIVTVSPVPLSTTFTGRDVVEATTYSKSLLRVVAEDFAAEKANVEYFPSYEIVMNSPRAKAWMEDCRHVRGELANFIMGQFISHFVPEEKVQPGEKLVGSDYVG